MMHPSRHPEYFKKTPFFRWKKLHRRIDIRWGADMETKRDGRQRASVQSGIIVDIIQKQDQRSNKKARGIVAEILTSTSFHPHGIKVRLKDGRVGRVTEVFSMESADDVT